MSFCPSKDIHSLYVDGELPEKFKTEYERHLANCEKCQRELAKVRTIHSALNSDADTIKLDEKFMEDSFQRLQIKMVYSKNTQLLKANPKYKSIGYVAGIAAAAVVALVVPVRINSAKNSERSIISLPTTNGMTVSTNNINFSSGRSDVVSGNISEASMSPTSRVQTTTFANNVSNVDLLRPDFRDNAISIIITVPGINDIPMTKEIKVPVAVSGRY